ncbi:MAG TPA: hypothetical protein VFQ85_06335 [Mycobacteriales bacterium]|jgi:hypothetical protein|nr:hypothetical protein [Mycobacteriales bacterium]
MRTQAMTVAVATATALLGAPFAARAATAVTTTADPVVAVLAPDADGHRRLYTMPADGSADPALLVAAPEGLTLIDAAVSPDGTRVVYAQSVHAPDDTPFTVELWVRDLAGGTPVRLTPDDDTAYDADPAWSADGTTIAFTRSQPGTQPSIWTVPADGSAAHTRVPGSAYLSSPSFSPSGRQLAVRGSDGVGILTRSTGTFAALVGTEFGTEPAWSPDGRTIAFSYGGPVGCTVPVRTVPVRGGTPTNVRAVEGHAALWPRWSRDGSRLFWTERGTGADGCTEAGLDVWSGAADGSGAAVLRTTADLGERGLTAGGGAAPAADTTPPAAPVVAAAGSVTATGAEISWTADADASEFVVVRVPHGATPPVSPSDGTVAYDGAQRTAHLGNLTTGTVYDLYVFALDAWGNFSPASAVHPVRPTAAPVMTPIGLHLGPDTALRPSWQGAYAPYHAEVARKGTPFRTLADTSKTSTYYATKQGVEYELRVRGTDGFGNATGYSPAIRANVPFDNGYYGLRYSAGWDLGYSNSRYGTSLRWQTARGASVTFTDSTSGFVVIGDRCAGCGRMRVYIDGVYSTTVDTYSATPQYRQVLYRRDGNGVVRSRTITLVVEGTAGRPRVAFDALALIR